MEDSVSLALVDWLDVFGSSVRQEQLADVDVDVGLVEVWMSVVAGRGGRGKARRDKARMSLTLPPQCEGDTVS